MKLIFLILITTVVIVGFFKLNKSKNAHSLQIQEPIVLRVKVENGIDEMLNVIMEKLSAKNNSFLTNITYNNIVLFQLIHPGMMEITKTKKNNFGITISLNFDDEEELQKKFLQLDFSKNYKYYEFQEIPSYIRNNGIELTKLKFEISEILKNVYELNNESNIEIEIYDQGSIEYVIPN